ncbi:serine protease [Streptomyces sp. NPDC051740]|uniref:serine protease n=1 Tax=Streptomyces sp. NPDC051740 TaxID=3365673 RepID=UPI0037A1A298
MPSPYEYEPRHERETPDDAPGLCDVLVRLHDLAGRPRGTGFVADHHGTVITSHEAVDGLPRIVLHAAAGRQCVVTADAVTPLPALGLALVRSEGLGVAPLPVTTRRTVRPGTYVRIPAGGWREARVLGTGPVTYTATDRAYALGDALELAVGTAGRDALRLGGGAAGGPVLDATTGTVLGVLGTALHSDDRAEGFAVRLPPRAPAEGPLAELLTENTATVPAHGADLNLAGVVQLTAGSGGWGGPGGGVGLVGWSVVRAGGSSAGWGGAVGGVGLVGRSVVRAGGSSAGGDGSAGGVGSAVGAGGSSAGRDGPTGDVGPVDRSAVLAEFAAFERGEAAVLGLVGPPGSGRTTQLAALAARRHRAGRPTLRLRGADLDEGDGSVADAARRALDRAAALVAASRAPFPAGPDTLGDVSPEHLAGLARTAGHPLLLLLDGPEEILLDRPAEWTAGTVRWLRATGARMVVACRAEYWEEAGFPEELLHAGAPRPDGLPACVALGDLTAEEARRARARHGVPEGALADADARHPLTLRMLADIRSAQADTAPDAPVDRDDVFSAHLDLMCLRIAVRLADGNGIRGTAVRRLAAKVAGQVHEAARRSLGAGGLDRETFDAVFPRGAAPARLGGGTGWASAVLAEGLLVPAGTTGYRFADEELADWLHGTHLDVDDALRALVHTAPATPVAPGGRAPRPAAAEDGFPLPGGRPRSAAVSGGRDVAEGALPSSGRRTGAADGRRAVPVAPGGRAPRPAAEDGFPLPGDRPRSAAVSGGRDVAEGALPSSGRRTGAADGRRAVPVAPGGRAPRPAAAEDGFPLPGDRPRSAAASGGRDAADCLLPLPGRRADGRRTPGPTSASGGRGAVEGALPLSGRWAGSAGDRRGLPAVAFDPWTVAGPDPWAVADTDYRPADDRLFHHSGVTADDGGGGVAAGRPALPAVGLLPAAPGAETVLPAGTPVPHHRIGVVVEALLFLARRHGSRRLSTRLTDLVHALDADPGSWWAARLLGGTLARVADATPYTDVLRLLADRLVAWREQRRGAPPELGPAFWTALRLPPETRCALLRRLVHADGPPCENGPRFLDATARLLAADPVAVLPYLIRWFEDERPLPATPHATVATAAQALLHTHRHAAPDALTEALADSAHRRADQLLTVLTEEEPAAMCRAVDRWAKDGRPARRATAVAYGLLVAPYARDDTDRTLLRYAALAVLVRTTDRELHGGALTLLIRDPNSRDRHLPRALERFAAGDPHLPPSALTPALATHPEPVLDAFRARLGGASAGETLRALADATPPAPARQVAALVRETVERRPELTGQVAAYADGRLERGPAARAVLRTLLTGLLDGGPQPLRVALAGILAGPGTPASRPLRRELLDTLLARESDPAVLEAVLRAAARNTGPEPRVLVHRTGLLLARTTEGATRFDRCLADLGSHVPGFAAAVAGWLTDAPREWSALIGPATRRTVEDLAGAVVPA